MFYKLELHLKCFSCHDDNLKLNLMVSFQFGFRNNLRWWQSLEEDPDKDGLEDEDSLNRGRERLEKHFLPLF